MSSLFSIQTFSILTRPPLTAPVHCRLQGRETFFDKAKKSTFLNTFSLQKLNIVETRTYLVATDLTFPFHLVTKKWIRAAIPAVHQQISLRLGR